MKSGEVLSAKSRLENLDRGPQADLVGTNPDVGLLRALAISQPRAFRELAFPRRNPAASGPGLLKARIRAFSEWRVTRSEGACGISREETSGTPSGTTSES